MVQANGESAGLTLGSVSNFFGDVIFDLQFDSVTGVIGELDWALRLAGDQQSVLQGYLDSGSIITSGADGQSISVIYDVDLYGDFTHLGFVTASAIPEPNSFAAMFLIGCAVAGRRKRCFAKLTNLKPIG